MSEIYIKALDEKNSNNNLLSNDKFEVIELLGRQQNSRMLKKEKNSKSKNQKIKIKVSEQFLKVNTFIDLYTTKDITLLNKQSSNNDKIFRYTNQFKKNTAAVINKIQEKGEFTDKNNSKTMQVTKKVIRPYSSYSRNNKEKSIPKNSATNTQTTTQATNQDDSPFKKIKLIKPQHNYIKCTLPPTRLTAFSYIIYQEPNIIHLSWNSLISIQIASLTKIMTCLVIIKIIQNNKEYLKQKVQIGIMESTIIGTTAGLVKGQLYTIQQLLYGLMLPSGNDASLALAIWGGKYFSLNKNKDYNPSICEMNKLKKRQSINIFVQMMNKTAQELNLKKTHYANPHGLSNIQNKSCSYDLAKLCSHAMSIQMFRKIVSTKEYSCVIQNTKYGTKKYVNWQNTHKLLKRKEYLGIKTGLTTTAGSCLASCVRTTNQRELIIIVLKCSKIQKRFKQTQILKRWILKKQKLRADKGMSCSNSNFQDIQSNVQQFQQKQDFD